MSREPSLFQLSRRRFAFWLGLGLFNLSEVLGAEGLDDLAAATMNAADASPKSPAVPIEHWTVGENNTWRWFERETLLDGRWKVTGITTPVHKRTGERFKEHTGYLDESLVPEALRRGDTPSDTVDDGTIEEDPGQPNAYRRARHGRPPSRWLRSLKADELRIWLKTIDPPEAGVSGMTFWEHLTRDHSFDPVKIEGLSIDEQAKLHAAAHYGY